MNQQDIVVQTSVGTQAVSRFFSKVYTWMTLGLTLTGFVASYVFSHPEIQKKIFESSGNLMMIVLAQLGLVFFLSARINHLRSTTATALFLGYAALNGLTFSSIFLIYSGQSIAQVFFITAGTFAGMSLYGALTKKDLTKIGQMAIMGLFGVILASLVNMFFRSSAFDFMISVIGVVIFVALTAYDTQKLKVMATSFQEENEGYAKAAILGALALYLDFINLFIMLLRLFGGRRR
ncbi:MAG: Bax inhibitor-1/YccA family protein [Deltaproteobacteria bacterium]|nr:Bax inhibitor-1/YccA family protein [Deltaproteobacteria bacterium]